MRKKIDFNNITFKSEVNNPCPHSPNISYESAVNKCVLWATLLTLTRMTSARETELWMTYHVTFEYKGDNNY